MVNEVVVNFEGLVMLAKLPYTLGMIVKIGLDTVYKEKVSGVSSLG